MINTIKNRHFYWVWKAMKARCNNKNNKGYKNYGGRGIYYTSSWEEFKGFYKDMFSSYKRGLTLERIDNNGNYCKENCKWILKSDQSKNRRNNIFVKYEGKNYKLFEISKLHGLKYARLYERLFRYKVPLEAALKNNFKKRKAYTFSQKKMIAKCKDCRKDFNKKGANQLRCEKCIKKNYTKYHYEYNIKRRLLK